MTITSILQDDGEEKQKKDMLNHFRTALEALNTLFTGHAFLTDNGRPVVMGMPVRWRQSDVVYLYTCSIEVTMVTADADFR